jgi:hypothetical protein
VDGGVGLTVARGIALRITAVLNNGVGYLRVQTGVDERHLFKYKSERIMGWGEKALLRAVVIITSMRVGRGVVGTSFSAMAIDIRDTVGSGKNHCA